MRFALRGLELGLQGLSMLRRPQDAPFNLQDGRLQEADLPVATGHGLEQGLRPYRHRPQLLHLGHGGDACHILYGLLCRSRSLHLSTGGRLLHWCLCLQAAIFEPILKAPSREAILQARSDLVEDVLEAVVLHRLRCCRCRLCGDLRRRCSRRWRVWLCGLWRRRRGRGAVVPEELFECAVVRRGLEHLSHPQADRVDVHLPWWLLGCL
mmetsp:Transcript_126648/g.270193  ORF Transcript_126648/g.270193 Transcript_126648/m.270193 type:complete len:209 (-) Transcript_126648:1259-1885(-)